jgi:hypothetical protein
VLLVAFFFAVLVAPSSEYSLAATIVEPDVGQWSYSYVRCDNPHGGFGTEAEAAYAGMWNYYGMCSDPNIASSSGWGTKESPRYGTCGSTNLYPQFKLGVEYINAQGFLVGYCYPPLYPSGPLSDGFTIYRERAVTCPADSKPDPWGIRRVSARRQGLG